MPIRIKVHARDFGKDTMEFEVEDIMTVQSFFMQVAKKNVFETGPMFYMETLNGLVCEPSKKFQELKEREFNIVKGLPPEPPTIDQLGILLLDGSRSMLQGSARDGSVPADALNTAVKNLIQKFRKSYKKANFSFGIIAFGDDAKVILPPVSVMRIDEKQNFKATDYYESGLGSRSTNISAGLQKAQEMAADFFNNPKNGLPQSVVIVLLSDGMCHHAEETRQIALSFKQMPKVEINTCHFETGLNEHGAVSLLKDISTDPEKNYRTVYDEVTVRNFFIQSSLRFPEG